MKKARWFIDADKLTARRVARGMKAVELARRAGIAERTLGRYQSGASPTGDVEHLRALARVLGVSVEHFAQPTPTPTSTSTSTSTSTPTPTPTPTPTSTPAASPYAPPPERAKLLASTQLENIVSLESRLPPPPPVPFEKEQIPVLTARKLQSVFSAFAVHEGERFAVIGHVAKHRGASPVEARVIGSRHGVAVRFLLARAIGGDADIKVTVHSVTARDTRLLLRAFEEERETCAIVKVVLAPEEMVQGGGGFDLFLSPKPLPWTFAVVGVAAG